MDDEAAPPAFRFPWVTATIVAVVVATAIAQHVVPGWYDALARDGLTTQPDQWWRVATALFAYDDGLPQVASVVAAAAILGLVGEGAFGAIAWLALFLVPGLLGQAIGVAWQPMGAGSSVAVAGQLGAVAVWALLPGTRVPAFARIGPVLVLLGAVALVVYREIHGPSVLAGAVLAPFLVRRG